MKRKLALIFISTFCFILMASCLVACNVAITSADFKTTNHTVDPFSSIDIDVDVSEIKLVKSADKTYAVTCYETDKYYHKVSVENGTLKIKSVSALGINLNIGWAKSPEITIYLSEDVYNGLKVSADTGAVSIDKGLTFGSVDIDTDTGAVDCSADITNTVDINTDTGAIRIDGITKASAINVDCSTGLVSLNDVKCADLNVESDTGAINAKNVECTIASIDADTGKVTLTNFKTAMLVASTNTGDVYLNNVEILGAITIMSDTGNIHGSLRLADNVVSKIKTDAGNISVQYID